MDPIRKRIIKNCLWSLAPLAAIAAVIGSENHACAYFNFAVLGASLLNIVADALIESQKRLIKMQEAEIERLRRGGR